MGSLLLTPKNVSMLMFHPFLGQLISVSQQKRESIETQTKPKLSISVALFLLHFVLFVFLFAFVCLFHYYCGYYFHQFMYLMQFARRHLECNPVQ